jgi:uncharacterized protein YjlB
MSASYPPEETPSRHQLAGSRSVESYRFPDDGRIPNNADLPLLIYRGAIPLPGSQPAKAFEDLFATNDWTNSWRDGVYPFHHFHSITHEVLGIYRGTANVQFGGPNGEPLQLEAGDVVIVPAGVGHRDVGSSGDLGVVGAYPGGGDWDVCRGDPGDRPRVDQNIAQVPLPTFDPVYGQEGPLFEYWKHAGQARAHL